MRNVVMVVRVVVVLSVVVVRLVVIVLGSFFSFVVWALDEAADTVGLSALKKVSETISLSSTRGAFVEEVPRFAVVAEPVLVFGDKVDVVPVLGVVTVAVVVRGACVVGLVTVSIAGSE